MPVGVFCPYFGVFHSLFSKFCVFYIIEQTVIVLFHVVDITGYSMHFISYLYRHGCLLALLCIVVIVAPNCIFAGSVGTAWHHFCFSCKCWALLCCCIATFRTCLVFIAF